MTDDERLAEIERREKAATPGEWKFKVEPGGGCDEGRIVSVPLHGPPPKPGWQETGIVCDFGSSESYDQCAGSPPEPPDLDFILHARADVPWLVARLKAALPDLAKAHREIYAWQTAVAELADKDPMPRGYQIVRHLGARVAELVDDPAFDADGGGGRG